ncbi:helicase associated domain-containing protein [Streptomyces ipomoeae]|uniref:helicase associated domain-containing protein n=1 Tax=Streptomyces ipomoeae TaxID=103232 RepID=UPI0029C08F0C|nr:helicase associated domain-containing protein [Streptomyces ipomoeae]
MWFTRSPSSRSSVRDQYGHLDVPADYLRTHGRLAAPATTPVGAWLAEQRHLAAKNTLDQARADALSALAPDWRLPHGADWHRKYHLLRAHLADGADPAARSPATPSWPG